MNEDKINHPKHYTQHPSGIECIQITELLPFNLGNVIKYLWRADEKGFALEDLKKAQWYLRREMLRVHPHRAESHPYKFAVWGVFKERNIHLSDFVFSEQRNIDEAFHNIMIFVWEGLVGYLQEAEIWLTKEIVEREKEQTNKIKSKEKPRKKLKKKLKKKRLQKVQKRKTPQKSLHQRKKVKNKLTLSQ